MRRARCARLVQQALCHGVRRGAHAVQGREKKERCDVVVEIVDEQRQSIATARTGFALIRSRGAARENEGPVRESRTTYQHFRRTIALH